MTSRKIQITAFAAFIAMWAVSLWCYGTLPERFPSHFDINGVPDGHMEKSPASWFALPFIFTLLTGFFVALAAGLPRLAKKHAAIINVPNKAAFLALPEEARVRALEPVRDLMHVMIVPLAFDSIYIAYGAWRVATEGVRTLPAWPVLFVVGFALAALVVTITRMNKAIERETAAPAG
jgi:uncharacterized membrane protein